MKYFSRRDFQLSLAAAIGATSATVGRAAQASPDPRIAIIDTDDDVRKLLSLIGGDNKRKGIDIVARYYARGCQSSFPFKRFALNKENYQCGGNHWSGAAEYDLLLERGFAILSVSQFSSSNPSKFLFGLQDVQDQIRRSQKPIAIAAPEAEAEADAHAVIVQSKIVKQPEQSAVYFGVDFDLRRSGPVRNLQGKIIFDRSGQPVQSQQATDAVITYFSRLKELLGSRLGAYSNGYINRLLRQKDLIRYSWVSESRSFLETPEYIADKDSKTPWHLFQNQVDRRWSNGFSLDTLVQNPKVTSIGAWNDQGLFDVNSERTQEIFNRRWIAVRDKIPVLDASGRPLLLQGHEGPQRNRSVRVVKDLGDTIQIDVDDDGSAEGFCSKVDPSTSKPNFARSLYEMPHW